MTANGGKCLSALWLIFSINSLFMVLQESRKMQLNKILIKRRVSDKIWLEKALECL